MHNLFGNIIKARDYLIVGLLAFSIEFISFLAIFKLLPFLLIAQSLSFSAGLAVSFFGNRHYTFRNTEFAHKASTQAIKYAILAVTNLILTNIIIYLLVNEAMIDPFLAKVFTMGAVVTWNFVIFNKFIFKS